MISSLSQVKFTDSLFRRGKIPLAELYLKWKAMTYTFSLNTASHLLVTELQDSKERKNKPFMSLVLTGVITGVTLWPFIFLVYWYSQMLH